MDAVCSSDIVSIIFGQTEFINTIFLQFNKIILYNVLNRKMELRRTGILTHPQSSTGLQVRSHICALMTHNPEIHLIRRKQTDHASAFMSKIFGHGRWHGRPCKSIFFQYSLIVVQNLITISHIVCVCVQTEGPKKFLAHWYPAP